VELKAVLHPRDITRETCCLLFFFFLIYNSFSLPPVIQALNNPVQKILDATDDEFVYLFFAHFLFRTNTDDIPSNPAIKHRKLKGPVSKYLPPFGDLPSGKFIFPSPSINYDLAANVKNEIDFSIKPQMQIETTLQKKEEWLKGHGYSQNTINVDGDGGCLFRASSRFTFGTDKLCHDLRMLVG
jgi:hypothetical protein